MWEKSTFDGYHAWTGTTAAMRIVVIPELGSKIVSLMDMKHNREWLAQSDRLGNGGYNTAFAKGDLRGWDEMLPSVMASQYTEEPWNNIGIPDHGEVWSIPWTDEADEVDERTLSCQVSGVRFPYQVMKQIKLQDDRTVRIQYRLRNTSPFEFKFIWAAHPTFLIEEGMQIVLPANENSPVAFKATNDPVIEACQGQHTWPITAGGSVPLDRIPAWNERFSKIHFQQSLAEGWARLCAQEASITMEFPLDKVPYFSIWQNYGGKLGKYHLSMQPSTAPCDDLAEAIASGKTAVVQPNGVYEWHLNICLDDAPL